MYYLHVDNDRYEFKEGSTLLEIIREHNLGMESPCGGKGICGKCKIKIIDGKINDPTKEEINYLSKEELENNIRLGCLVRPIGDLTVKFIENKNVKHKILSDGYMPNLNISPLLSKKIYKLNKPTLENNLPYDEILENILQNSDIKNDIHTLRVLNEGFEVGEITAVYLNEEIIGIEINDTTSEIYSIGIDIGTTTVVASLVDINSGKEIDCESEINPQKEYGLDVLSRIHFAKTEDNGVDILQKSIISCINKLISNLCIRNNIDKNKIYEIVVAANTTMNHLLLGVNPSSIGKSPYSPVFTEGKNMKASELGLSIATFGRIYTLPSVSSYIGGDIVAGVIVSNLHKIDRNVLFIDIGTNGEIVLSKKGKLYSCSCAAGPALEGMNISSGMRASDGAIEKINITNDGIELKIIGDTNPIGICGSGILDAISEVARLNIVGKTGRLKKKSDLEEDENLKHISEFLIEEDKKRKFLITSDTKEICITQDDIRQVQLAKGAILSGFYALLDVMEINMDDLEEVVIAGQFGKHLSVDSLVGVGIVPETLKDKISYVGNSSKVGALMCILSKESRKEVEVISKNINYFELSTKEGYDRLFTKCLNFS